MKDLTELYNNDIEQFIKELEVIPSPKQAEETWITWANDLFGADESKWNTFFEKLTEQQRMRLNNLNSSERQKEYLLKVTETRSLSYEEWNDLRACDF